jgi:hypothetical protein
MRDERKKSLFDWARRSFVGCVVLVQIWFTLPMFVFFSALNYYDGTLTLVWLFFSLLVTSVCGFFCAIGVWLFGLRAKRKYGYKP